MKRLIVLFVLTLLLPGCAEMMAKRQQNIDQFRQTIPSCTEETCKARWNAAQAWIVKNCGMKLQIVTDTVIETYNPPKNSLTLAARVLKEPIGNGEYKIIITTYCDNIFGCSPDALDAANDFNRYVLRF